MADAGGKVGLAAALEVLAESGEIGRFEREPELPLGPSDAMRASVAAGFRGPGRPPNSRNRRTQEMLDYLRDKGYADPLEVLAATYSRPVAELARELGCTVEEAFDKQQWAAKEMAPFYHSKAPVEIDAKGGLIAPLVMMMGDGVGGMRVVQDPGLVVLDQQPIKKDDKSDG